MYIAGIIAFIVYIIMAILVGISRNKDLMTGFMILTYFLSIIIVFICTSYYAILRV